MKINKYSSLIIILNILFTMFGCDKNPAANNSEPDIKSASIHIVSGNNQTGIGNKELDKPIIIKITDRAGKPVSNIEVNFEIIEGDGKLSLINPVSTDKNGFIEIRWVISSSYNAAKIFLENENINSTSVFIYATGDNPQGMAIARSINSLSKKGDNFYTMSFFGDYSNIVESVNTSFVGNSLLRHSINYHCSLFSAFGNSNEYLFGRSFDNPAGWQCITLLGEYNPINGYKSLAFSRMQDYGHQYGRELLDLNNVERMQLFESAGHVPDGINEYGVVAGLANVNPQDYIPDGNKKTIWVTVLVRKILDNSKTIEEAIEIANKYNISCPDNNTLGIHVLVADATGKSAILEMGEGALQVIPNSQTWQVITNSPSYNVSIETQKSTCNRFNYIYNYINNKNGFITVSEGMGILGNVGWSNATEWSAMYNLSDKTIEVAIDFDFDNIYRFQIDP